ncbi:MAG TPA: TIGR03936 family radical SAM-associated protein, partial [Thermoanaerobaculia bacterium]|nr:TIGR03936 family radical SAM-associated protein [Thermoanaerobaculia bacterium]
LDELVTLIANILAEGRRKGVRATVHVSIGSYVPKSFTPFQWSAFDGVEQLSEKLVYLREKFRPVRGAKLKWHEPKEAEIEAMLSLGDRRMSKALLEVWKRGGKFDGWSEHFSWQRWTEALEAAGIPKERHLRQKDLKETLPWDIVDASIRKPFLVVEWKKALQEMATDDCKWGHCTACGVPGNGEDTVLANGMPEGFSFALPSLAAPGSPGAAEPALSGGTAPTTTGTSLPSAAGVASGVSDARDEGRGTAYADKAKGAAYRMKATPDLLPLRERRKSRGGASESAALSKTWRVSFEKLGDARYLSHRNVMDVLERALRAARVPVRYTEGFNPHIRLSMGPALPLGQESRHELLDLDVVDTLTPEHLAAVNDRLPPGMRLLDWVELPAGSRSLGKVATEAVYRFTMPNGEELTQRLSLAGEGATTPKRFIETTWGLAAEDQHAIRVVREETVLTR